MVKGNEVKSQFEEKKRGRETQKLKSKKKKKKKEGRKAGSKRTCFSWGPAIQAVPVTSRASNPGRDGDLSF